MDRPMEMKKFVELIEGIVVKFGVSREKAATTYCIRRFLASAGLALRLAGEDRQALGDCMETPKGGESDTVARLPCLMATHYADARHLAACEVKEHIFRRTMELQEKMGMDKVTLQTLR